MPRTTKAEPAKAAAPRPTKAAPAKAVATKAAPKSATKVVTPQSESPAQARVVPEDKWLAKQQASLLAQRATLQASARALKDEADALVRDAEPGDTKFDEEGGEGGTTAMDRELDLVLSAQQTAQVKEIDVALDKIDAGTYGICEVTHKPIPKARLEAIPWASVSVEAKTGGLRSRR